MELHAGEDEKKNAFDVFLPALSYFVFCGLYQAFVHIDITSFRAKERVRFQARAFNSATE